MGLVDGRMVVVMGPDKVSAVRTLWHSPRGRSRGGQHIGVDLD